MYGVVHRVHVCVGPHCLVCQTSRITFVIAKLLPKGFDPVRPPRICSSHCSPRIDRPATERKRSTFGRRCTTSLYSGLAKRRVHVHVQIMKMRARDSSSKFTDSLQRMNETPSAPSGGGCSHDVRFRHHQTWGCCVCCEQRPGVRAIPLSLRSS